MVRPAATSPERISGPSFLFTNGALQIAEGDDSSSCQFGFRRHTTVTMKSISILGISAFLVLCMCGPYSGEVMAKNDNQMEAEKLLMQAEELTDIRAPVSQAFRLSARVKLFDEKGQASEGTYDLVWKTPTDWQDKLGIGDFSQERTAVVDKLFVRRSTPSFTLEVYNLLRLLEFPRLLRVSPEAKAQKLREKTRNGSRERTIDLGWKTIFLDESTPTPTRVEYKHSRFGYKFENYAAFHGHQFPRILTEFDSNKTLTEVQVQELTEASIDDSNLVPSPEARWYLWCPHPEPMRWLDLGKVYPGPPLRTGAPNHPVVIYGVVGTDGKWHNLTVVKSGGKEVDEYWMNVMRQERFSPARCGEVPVLQEFVMKSQ
jgi:hypothetical protein